MFISLQKAAQNCSSRLHFVMAGWFPGGETDHQRYIEAARFHAPDVSVHFLDGKNADVVRCCWAEVYNTVLFVYFRLCCSDGNTRM